MRRGVVVAVALGTSGCTYGLQHIDVTKSSDLAWRSVPTATATPPAEDPSPGAPPPSGAPLGTACARDTDCDGSLVCNAGTCQAMK